MDAVYKFINNISKFDSAASEKTRSLVMIIVRNVALNKYNYNKYHIAVGFDEEAESDTVIYGTDEPITLKKLDNRLCLWYNSCVNRIMVTGGQYPRRVEARKHFACRPYVR